MRKGLYPQNSIKFFSLFERENESKKTPGRAALCCSFGEKRASPRRRMVRCENGRKKRLIRLAQERSNSGLYSGRSVLVGLLNAAFLFPTFLVSASSCWNIDLGVNKTELLKLYSQLI